MNVGVIQPLSELVVRLNTQDSREPLTARIDQTGNFLVFGRLLSDTEKNPSYESPRRFYSSQYYLTHPGQALTVAQDIIRLKKPGAEIEYSCWNPLEEEPFDPLSIGKWTPKTSEWENISSIDKTFRCMIQYSFRLRPQDSTAV